jgi:hypothetical protein
MFRKTILALAAIGALGTAAMAPTSASAHWYGYGWKGYHGKHYGYWKPRHRCFYNYYGHLVCPRGYY